MLQDSAPVGAAGPSAEPERTSRKHEHLWKAAAEMYKIKAESADEWRAEADKARAGAAKFKKDAEILEMENARQAELISQLERDMRFWESQCLAFEVVLGQLGSLDPEADLHEALSANVKWVAGLIGSRQQDGAAKIVKLEKTQCKTEAMMASEEHADSEGSDSLMYPEDDGSSIAPSTPASTPAPRASFSLKRSLAPLSHRTIKKPRFTTPAPGTTPSPTPTSTLTLPTVNPAAAYHTQAQHDALEAAYLRTKQGPRKADHILLGPALFAQIHAHLVHPAGPPLPPAERQWVALNAFEVLPSTTSAHTARASVGVDTPTASSSRGGGEGQAASEPRLAMRKREVVSRGAALRAALVAAHGTEHRGLKATWARVAARWAMVPKQFVRTWVQECPGCAARRRTLVAAPAVSVESHGVQSEGGA